MSLLEYCFVLSFLQNHRMVFPHRAPHISLEGMFLCTVTVQVSIFLCSFVSEEHRAVSADTGTHPLSRALFSRAWQMPSSPAPLPSTQSSASILGFDYNFHSFWHKGSFPKPSLLQQQHPHLCGPQPSSSYLINSFWQREKS